MGELAAGGCRGDCRRARRLPPARRGQHRRTTQRDRLRRRCQIAVWARQIRGAESLGAVSSRMDRTIVRVGKLYTH